MNRNREEAQFNAIFEEDKPVSSPAEQELAWIRDGLKALGSENIPETDLDLSRDRLRASILDLGLKPAKKNRIGSVLTFGSSVAVCAAMFLVYQNMSGTSEPSSKVATNDSKTPVVSAFAEIEPEPLNVTMNEVGPTETEIDCELVVSQSQKHKPKNRGRRQEPKAPEVLLATRFGAASPEVPSAPEISMANLDARPSNSLDEEDDQVVLIQHRTDSVTGAQSATEVASTSHVVVGG